MILCRRTGSVEDYANLPLVADRLPDGVMRKIEARVIVTKSGGRFFHVTKSEVLGEEVPVAITQLGVSHLSSPGAEEDPESNSPRWT